MEDYKKMAEENLVEMRKQEELNNSRLLLLENVIRNTSMITVVLLILIGSFAVTSTIWRVVVFVAAAVILAVGAVFSLRLQHDVGYYECPNCGKRYIPSMKAVVFAARIGRTRRMKCPYCGKTGFHKKVLTDK